MKLLAYLSFALITITAHAQFVLVQSWTGGNDVSVGPGTAALDFTEGAVPQTVHGLGIWDASGTGLSESHRVGLWDFDTQTLIASTTVVPATATDIGGFWYEPVAPLTLQAGHHYMLGAFYADNSFDLAHANATATVLSGATLGNAWLSTSSGFSFPNLNVSGADQGFFGANISFAAVPEPGAWSAIFAIGLLAFSLVRGFASPTNAVSVRALLDAKPTERARLAAIVAQKRPAALPAVRAENRPPVTPGNDHGNRPVTPPGLVDYGKP